MFCLPLAVYRVKPRDASATVLSNVAIWLPLLGETNYEVGGIDSANVNDPDWRASTSGIYANQTEALCEEGMCDSVNECVCLSVRLWLHLSGVNVIKLVGLVMLT